MQQIVLIKWRDSGSLYGWQCPTSIKEFKPIIAYTVGMMVEETKEYVKIVQTTSNDGDMGNAFVIPKGCILSWKVIKKYDID